MDLHQQGTIPGESANLKTTAQAATAGERDSLAIDAREVQTMSQMNLYPLRFEPIYQYRLWGGRRLGAADRFDVYYGMATTGLASLASTYRIPYGQ